MVAFQLTYFTGLTSKRSKIQGNKRTAFLLLFFASIIFQNFN